MNPRQFGCPALIVISMLGLSCGASRQEINSGKSAAVADQAQRTPRKVYRYSVIPGGVYSSDELERVRRIDPVVAAHYVDFGRRVRVQPSSGATLFYISYRKGDHVYWTRKKHRVPSGEALLTDGTNLARTRCGNRLSLLPQLPALTINEPNENELAGIQPPQNPIPEMPPAPLISPGLDAPLFPSGAVSVPPFPMARTGAGDAATPVTSPFLLPAYAPIGFGFGFPIGGVSGTTKPTGTSGGSTGAATGGQPTTGTGGGTTGGGGTTTGGGGATTIPEPGSSILLLAGAALLSFTRLRRTGNPGRRPS